MGDACRACGASDLRLFHEVERVPVSCCQLMASREQALEVPVGALRLELCPACGFVQNGAFDPERVDYRESYEDSQAFSPRFQAFARALAQRLIDAYGLRGRDVLEIGCGRGDFLALLCELGGNRGVGFDPAWRPERRPESAPADVRFVPEFYSRRHASLRADLVCCRHTLEHLPRVREFLAMLRDALAPHPGTVVFFEVPDVGRVLDELAFWDLYYEHCSYFSPGSLARLFRACGFEVLRLEKAFDDQYLLIDARTGDGAPAAPAPEEDDVARLAAAAERFAREVPASLAHWRERLGALAASGRRTLLWGAGSKAVGFLSTLGGAGAIEHVVDVNPHKQGMFLPGTGQRIVAPELLRENAPDLVIVMNPIYLDEIRGQLAGLGLHPQVEAL